jgi:hypothetical protein
LRRALIGYFELPLSAVSFVDREASDRTDEGLGG